MSCSIEHLPPSPRPVESSASSRVEDRGRSGTRLLAAVTRPSDLPDSIDRDDPDPADQARDLPVDGHVHTDLRPAGGVTIDGCAAQAVERRIAERAITAHVDFVPGTPAFWYVPFADRERI